MNNGFEQILLRTPLDDLASKVTSQANCTDIGEMDYDAQIKHMMDKTEEAKRIKSQLGITTRSQWKNIRLRMNKGQRVKQRDKNPYLFDKLVAVIASYRIIQLNIARYNIMRQSALNKNS